MSKVIELAKQAGFDTINDKVYVFAGQHNISVELELYTKLVRNATLDEAALICFRNASFTGDTIDRARLLECGTAIRNIKDKTP